MGFENQEEKTFNRAVIGFDKVINDCFRWRNYSKKTYTDAEGTMLQKVRMFLYKSTGTFIWQGWNTSVQIQTLRWLKEQVSIPYYTKHFYLFTTFLLPALAIIHWSSVRLCKVFPCNRKKRSLSKPVTEICWWINERWEKTAASVHKISASHWNCWGYLMKNTKRKLQKVNASICIWSLKIGLYPCSQKISVIWNNPLFGHYFALSYDFRSSVTRFISVRKI